MGVPVRALAAIAIAISPTVLLLWLLGDPSRNPQWLIPVEHLVVTSNISLVAAFVALLVARQAIGGHHYKSLVVALGFASMAGLFLVHGLSTPNVLQRGDRAAPAALVIALSGQLSLGVASLFFAARYMPVLAWLERHVRPRALVAAVLVALGTYAVVALVWPEALGGVAAALLPTRGASTGSVLYGVTTVDTGGTLLPYLFITGALALYLFAAVVQSRDFMRTRLPLQGALALAFVLLAQAQLSQFLGPTWTPSWWEYHGLMLGAVVLALGALFLELDRRRGLERFLPPTVVERVVQGDALRLEGERQTVTILFADLRGSTALADKLAPEEVVAVVNEYLRAMARAVIDAGGILDKFTGDGLMAIFGALGDATNGATGAARAALAIRARIAALNAERAARGEQVINFGVGVHTGDVVLGAIGLPERSDFTAMGDTVNTASRMESLTKEFKVDAVLSRETADRLRDDGVALRPLGPAQVRGKANAVEVFALS